MEKEIPKELVETTHQWFGSDGLNFFIEMKSKYGKVDALFMEGKLPHPVHFREGMSVRNFMRSTVFCKEWGDHDLDDSWVSLVNKVLEYHLETDVEDMLDGILYDTNLKVEIPGKEASITLAVLDHVNGKLIRVLIPDMEINMAALVNEQLQKASLKYTDEPKIHIASRTVNLHLNTNSTVTGRMQCKKP